MALLIIAVIGILAALSAVSVKIISLVRDRRTVREAETRYLYDRYKVGIRALTHEYLQRAPSDEEWLTGAVQSHSPPT